MRTDPGRYQPHQWHDALHGRPAELPRVLTVPADWLTTREARRLAEAGFWGQVRVLRLTGATNGGQLRSILGDCPEVHSLQLHALTDFQGFGSAPVRTLILDDASGLGRMPTVESLTTRAFDWSQFPRLTELEFRGDIDLSELAGRQLSRLAAQTVRCGVGVPSLKHLQAETLEVTGEFSHLFPALESLECERAPVDLLSKGIGALAEFDVSTEVLEAGLGALKAAGRQVRRVGLRAEAGAAVALRSCPNLSEVSIDGAAVSDETSVILGSLRSLESLILSDVELPDEAPLTLSPSLESLRCGDSWLGTLVLAGAGLREVVFDDCRLPDDWFDEQLSRWAGPQTIKVGLRDCDTPPTVKFGQCAPNVRHLILDGVGPSTVSGVEATLETLELRDSPAAADWIASHDWPRLQTLSVPGTANFSDLEVWLEARRAPLLNVLECDIQREAEAAAKKKVTGKYKLTSVTVVERGKSWFIKAEVKDTNKKNTGDKKGSATAPLSGGGWIAKSKSGKEFFAANNFESYNKQLAQEAERDLKAWAKKDDKKGKLKDKVEDVERDADKKLDQKYEKLDMELEVDKAASKDGKTVVKGIIQPNYYEWRMVLEGGGLEDIAEAIRAWSRRNNTLYNDGVSKTTSKGSHWISTMSGTKSRRTTLRMCGSLLRRSVRTAIAWWSAWSERATRLIGERCLTRSSAKTARHDPMTQSLKRRGNKPLTRLAPTGLRSVVENFKSMAKASFRLNDKNATSTATGDGRSKKKTDSDQGDRSAIQRYRISLKSGAVRGDSGKKYDSRTYRGQDWDNMTKDDSGNPLPQAEAERRIKAGLKARVKLVVAQFRRTGLPSAREEAQYGNPSYILEDATGGRLEAFLAKVSSKALELALAERGK